MSAIDAMRPLAFAVMLLCVLGLGAYLGVTGLLCIQRRIAARAGQHEASQFDLIDESS